MQKTLKEIKEKLLDQEFTPEKSIMVDQIDVILDKWEEEKP